MEVFFLQILKIEKRAKFRNVPYIFFVPLCCLKLKIVESFYAPLYQASALKFKVTGA